ncbi:MAG: pyruvate kinase [Thermodesulfobacteriota bacterium]|nr:pyruvate kinase [Thermodesulfobacteriota bacterium]
MDCVMLSAESAMGKYPIDAADMLAKLAAAIDIHRPNYYAGEILKAFGSKGSASFTDMIALSVNKTLKHVSPAVVVLTNSGTIARNVARFRLPVWTAAISAQKMTCHQLQFSCGVYPVYECDLPGEPEAIRQGLAAIAQNRRKPCDPD